MALRYGFVLGFLLASRADAVDPVITQKQGIVRTDSHVVQSQGIVRSVAGAGAPALDLDQLLDAEVEEAAIALRQASSALTKELSEIPKAEKIEKTAKVLKKSAAKVLKESAEIKESAAKVLKSLHPSSKVLANYASAVASAVASQVKAIADLKVDKSNAAKAIAKTSLRKTSAQTELEKADAETSLAKMQGLAKMQDLVTSAETVEPNPAKAETKSSKVTTKIDGREEEAKVLKVELKGKKVWPAKGKKVWPEPWGEQPNLEEKRLPITKAEPAEAIAASTQPKLEEKRQPSAMDSFIKDLQTGPKYESKSAQKETAEVAVEQKEMKAASKDEKGVVEQAWDAVAGAKQEHSDAHAETKKERDASHVKIRGDMAKDLEEANEAHAKHTARTKKEGDDANMKIKKDIRKSMQDHSENSAKVKKESDADSAKIKKDMEKHMQDHGPFLNKEKHLPATDDHNTDFRGKKTDDHKKM